MAFKCKLCNLIFGKQIKVLEHYRLHHRNVSSVSPLPCPYDCCICTFQSLNALKIHLTRIHSQKVVQSRDQSAVFLCPLCGCSQPFNDKNVLSHLRTHLKQHETLDCPFKNCHYRTNVYSSFNTHRSRCHPDSDISAFKCEIILKETANHPLQSNVEFENAGPSNYDYELGSPSSNPSESTHDTEELQNQLKNNLSSLFLKMYSVLHVSERAIQNIIDDLLQIFSLSKPLVRDSITNILHQHSQPVSEVVLNELVEAVMNTNVFVNAATAGAELSTAKRRKTFVRSHYPLVMPVQYSLGSSGPTVVYVPVLQMLQSMFKNTDILDKIKETKQSPPGVYMSYTDGTYFKENQFLSAAGELRLSLILYVDDIELANPLGTARKIHKLTAVYWLLANLPSQYRSSLHVIQLALLCKVSDLQKHGYENVLSPLLKDLQTLEQEGLFIENLGECIKGSVLFVAADNLAAHGLAGFVQSFRAHHFCRFCCCTANQMQTTEVSEGEFTMRTTECHDLLVEKTVQEDNLNHVGVKDDCPLRKALQHFHPITGFPPDILHDLFEGIVPVELALCIGELIRRKYFSLEYLNTKIRTFPYQHSDRLDKPQPIPKNFASKLSIGGNGHENSTLLRLIPLMVGSKVPEQDEVWATMMDLKEVVQLVLSPSFTEESIQYLQTKIKEHRQGLKTVFPDFKLKPKHHYIEHYPELTKHFGPLINLWTMRFEGKHRFFQRSYSGYKELQECFENTCNQASAYDGISPQCTLVFQTASASFKCHLCPSCNFA